MRAVPGILVLLVLLVFLVLIVASCGEEEAQNRPAPAASETLLLRHGFKAGRELRYDSRTVERSAYEVTIEMRSRWRVSKVRTGGAAELGVTIERYTQRAYPPLEKLPPDVAKLNQGLAGAGFRLLVSPDGREIEHLGHEGLPEVSDFSIEALQNTLGSHILKLPEKAIRLGQRWTAETLPLADAGPGGVTSRSQWRVLSLRPTIAGRLVELVCLSTMEPGPLRVEGRLVKNRTEFHYSYLWNETEGVLEGLTSSGSTTTVTEAAPDASARTEDLTQRTTFEARLRLVGPASSGQGLGTVP